MATSGNSDAVLLLTAHLSGSDDSGAKPLEAFLKLEFRSLTRLIGSDTGGI